MKITVSFLAAIFLLLGVSSNASALEGVKLSKQAREALQSDICAQSAVASVRDYISELNDKSGTDVPDGGYPLPQVKQVLALEDGVYSVLVANYQLPSLNVKTKKNARSCKSGKPYTEEFFPGR